MFIQKYISFLNTKNTHNTIQKILNSLQFYFYFQSITTKCINKQQIQIEIKQV